MAAFVRDATATRSGDLAARVRLAARAAALGLPAEVVSDLERLRAPQGWRPVAELVDDAATALVWTTRSS